MIKREKNGKLRGSVLLTVVCVMSLLIVFLFGTLALATAANNRAHVNYSTAQTGVTSRTVVDAALKAMEVNTTFGKAVSDLSIDSNGGGFKVNVELGDNVPEKGRYGHIDPVDVRPVGKKQFYDATKKEWINGDIIKFTSTVAMAGVDSTTSAYIVKQPAGTEDGSGGGGAGFVTTAGADLTCQTNLYGGTYINVPKLGENKDDVEGYQAGTDDKADIPGAVFYDYSYTEKDGTKRKYENWNSDPTIYRQFKSYDKDDSSTYFKLGTDGGADAEADIYVNHNMDVQEWHKIIFPGVKKGITVWGDLYFRKQADKLEYVFNNINSTGIAFNEIPYIYVDGTISGEAIYLGNAKESNDPLNIFCGNIKADGVSVNIGGDLFCMNPTEKNIIKPASSNLLYSWTGSVLNKTDSTPKSHTTNSIYSKGSVEFDVIPSGMTINGDVRIEKDCTIKFSKDDGGIKEINNVGDLNFKIKGDLVVGGTLNIVYKETSNFKSPKSEIIKALLDDSTSGQIYCDKVLLNNQPFVNGGDITYKVPNDRRYYLWYDPKYDSNSGKYIGIFGEEFNTADRLYYRWNDAEDYPLNQLNQYEAQTNQMCENIKNGSDMEKKKYFKQEPDWPVVAGDRKQASADDTSTNYYYVKTTINPNPDDNSKKLTADKINDDGTLKIKDSWNSPFEDFDFKHDSEPSKEKYTTCTYPMEADNTLYSPKDDYKTDIYPEYAERDVILGKRKIAGIDKENTQVVKTMEEVLETIANPYEEGNLSLQLSEQYETVYQNNVCFTSLQEILNAPKTDKFKKKYAKDVKADGTYTLKDYDGSSTVGDGSGAIITNDCILDIRDENGNKGTIPGDKCGYLIFEPGTKDLLVVVKNFDANNNFKIIVNDSEGGTVNFYIENDSTMSFAANSWIAPTKYLKAFATNTSEKMSYGGGGGLELDKLGRPNINIYGKSNSELNSLNTCGFIANIVSPDLKFTTSAGAKMDVTKNIKEMCYNGQSVDCTVKPFVIGCVNSSFADIPNTLSVIFVTNKKAVVTVPPTDDDGIFNYRVLYYDEY